MNKAEIKHLRLPETKVITIRYKGAYKDLKTYFARLEEIANNNAYGAPFALYHDKNYQKEADIEVCYPVMEKMTLPEDISFKILPEVEVISIFHQGSYQTLPKSYEILETYMKKCQLKPDVPSREIYLNGFQKMPKEHPEMNQTQIAIPFTSLE